MPTIELWEKTGKGVFRVLHSIRPPIEVVVLEDARGNQYPIFEGNNEVPVGVYSILIVRPYAKEDSDVLRHTNCTVEVWHDEDEAYIVNIGDFVGGYIPYMGANWEKYAQARGDQLVRPAGWNPISAQRMLLEAKQRVG